MQTSSEASQMNRRKTSLAPRSLSHAAAWAALAASPRCGAANSVQGGGEFPQASLPSTWPRWSRCRRCRRAASSSCSRKHRIPRVPQSGRQLRALDSARGCVRRSATTVRRFERDDNSGTSTPAPTWSLKFDAPKRIRWCLGGAVALDPPPPPWATQRDREGDTPGPRSSTSRPT